MIIVLGIFMVVIVTACGSNKQKVSSEKNDVTALTEIYLNWLPEQFAGKDKVRGVTQYPNKEQHLYGENVYPLKEYLVLEVLKKDYEESTAKGEEIKVQGTKGILYQYQEGDIQFDLEEFPNMRIPKTDEWVLEWEMEEIHCRVFGTCTKEEMIKIAEGVQ